MPSQAQIKPSSMSSTGLSDAKLDTSAGSGMNAGMPLMWASRPALMAWNCSSKRVEELAFQQRQGEQLGDHTAAIWVPQVLVSS